jgi:dienelactone hydrolase
VRPASLVALVVVLALAVGAFAVRLTRTHGARTLADSEELSPSLEAPADWCTAGYEPIRGGCLAIPASSPHAPLLIYLHGRYEKDQSAEEADRQRRVAARFTSKGYAVLALRGKLGGCGAAELSTWYCWPSNDRTVGTAGQVVETWQAVFDETESRVHPEHRFVLGFSNGGYFATLLASRVLVHADAYVVAHGGPVEPVEAASSKPPLLLLSADDDIAQDDMLRLDAELTNSHWPHDSYARAGAHGLTDQDIDTALAFFARSKEPMPLAPPITGLHRPSHHDHDTGAAPSVVSGDDGPSTPDAEPTSAE